VTHWLTGDFFYAVPVPYDRVETATPESSFEEKTNFRYNQGASPVVPILGKVRVERRNQARDVVSFYRK
jgi:hypothetical protein